MSMEIARLTNTSWVQAPDRQVVAMRSVVLSLADWRKKLGRTSVRDLQPVPMLDWPHDLFEDESIDH